MRTRSLPVRFLFQQLMTCLTVLVIANFAMADGKDWPNFRGPNFDGISTETNWKSEFSGQPTKVWETNVGIGYGTFTIVDDKAYVAGWQNGRDILYCLDASNGKEIWSKGYAADRFARMHEGGPGSTPTVHDGRVYLVSRVGQLTCFAADDGKPLWEKNLAREYGVREGKWGFTGSAVIINGKLVLDVGKIIAFDPKTGNEIWQTRDYGAGYSTPAPFVLGRRKLIAAFPGHGLVILDDKSGKEIAERRWETSYDVNAATPIIDGNAIFISSNYNVGAALFKLDNRGLTRAWQTREMRNHMNSSVLIDGTLYGFDNGMLKAMSWDNGQEQWNQRGLGKGSLIAADGKLIVLSDSGELLIAPASPHGFSPTLRMKLFRASNCWASPVLSHGMLYARSPQGDAVCIDLSK